MGQKGIWGLQRDFKSLQGLALCRRQSRETTVKAGMKSSQGLVLQQHPSSLPHPRNSARPSGFTPSGGTFQRPCLRAVPADLSARKGSAVYKSLLDWGFVAVIRSRRENRIPAVTFSLTALPPEVRPSGVWWWCCLGFNRAPLPVRPTPLCTSLGLSSLRGNSPG